MRNRWFAMMVVSLFSLGVMTTPRQSQAIIGLSTGAIPLAVVGGVFTALGAGTSIWVLIEEKRCSGWNCLVVFYYALTLPVALAGIVILEEPTGGRIEFQRMDLARVRELSLTQNEIAVYNSEVEELNAIRQSIEASVDPSWDASRARSEIETSWRDALLWLSPETTAVLKAIAPAP